MRAQISVMSLIKMAFLIFSIISVSACGQLLASAKKDFSDDLSATILEFDDPETIKKAIPSFLIVMSSMIKGDPDNPDLLESGAQLYGAYAAGFADSKESKRALASRAFNYSSRAICIRDSNLCDLKKLSYFEFERRLAALEKPNAESLFIFISSWAGVIEANSADWNAVAELPKVKAGLRCVLETDETVSYGNAHLYMAVMETLLPPALGGKPELAKKHFDRAIELSHDTNLMAKVLYAEKYARLLFDRELHDQLLHQVIDAKIDENSQTLVNMLAKQKAAKLLVSADDYF